MSTASCTATLRESIVSRWQKSQGHDDASWSSTFLWEYLQGWVINSGSLKSFKKEAEGCPHCSLQPSEDRKWRGMEMLISSPLYPQIDWMGMIQSCVRDTPFRVDIGKNFFFFFYQKVVEHGRFPREVISAPSLPVSKSHLDNAHQGFNLISGDLVRQSDQIAVVSQFQLKHSIRFYSNLV